MARSIKAKKQREIIFCVCHPAWEGLFHYSVLIQPIKILRGLQCGRIQSLYVAIYITQDRMEKEQLVFVSVSNHILPAKCFFVCLFNYPDNLIFFLSFVFRENAPRLHVVFEFTIFKQ